MYAYIQGIVDELTPERAVIDAGGVGYELLCSANTIKRLKKGARARLLTHLHLAEGVMVLYGFYDEEERQMFRRLLGVTRVGPKLAQAVLAFLTPADVAAAVLTDNDRAFDRVPGMGRKGAQRVILELKEKVDAAEMLGESAQIAPESAADSGMRAEATAALVSLGYDGLAASRAVASVTDAERVEDLITQALRNIGKS
jgi:Holliday junction DNA helicase RuvA